MVVEVLSEQGYSVLPARTVEASLLSNLWQPEGDKGLQEDTKCVAYEQLTFPPSNSKVRNCENLVMDGITIFFVWYH
jgi:hypothetical protein